MTPLKFDLDGRAVLIGAVSTVIDRSNVLAFAAAHDTVLIGDADRWAEDTVCEIGAGGGESACRKADASGSTRLRELTAHTDH